MCTYPVEDDTMNNGEDGRETHGEEEAGADPAVLRSAKDGLGDSNDSGATKDRDHGNVHDLECPEAVEP